MIYLFITKKINDEKKEIVSHEIVVITNAGLNVSKLIDI